MFIVFHFNVVEEGNATSTAFLRFSHPTFDRVSFEPEFLEFVPSEVQLLPGTSVNILVGSSLAVYYSHWENTDVIYTSYFSGSAIS